MSINFESHKLDRRSFLKGAGVIGAAGLLSACGGSSSNNGAANSAASGTAAPNTTGGAPLSEYISFESANRELESWNMLYTQQASDPPLLPVGSTTRTPPSGRSTCATMSIGSMSTAR